MVATWSVSANSIGQASSNLIQKSSDQGALLAKCVGGVLDTPCQLESCHSLGYQTRHRSRLKTTKCSFV
eukprot:5812788-Amphidinium_carterae.2